MSLLALTGIHKRLPLPDCSVLTVLDGCDLTLDSGEHLAIVGRSGSGKSTLLNIVGLLDTPTAGGYLLDGEDTARLRAGRRAELRGSTFGFVFQQFNLLPGLSAAENVAAPLLYARGRQFWRRDQLARQMLDRVGLGPRADSMPSQLSGGEQQRVAIARALVRRPRVILADEPTGALDVDTGRQVMSLLESLVADEGAGLISITHDPAIAARAGRRLLMEHGHLTDATEVAA